VVDPRAVPHVQFAATKCINTLGEGINAIRAAGALNPVFLQNPPETTPPWPGLFDENSPGQAPAGAPLLIVQGAKDPTVEPQWTESFVSNACARNEVVEFKEYKGVTHLLIAYKSLPAVEGWIAARFAGAKAPDTCGA
jgi:alpha-beta hydrolase superfamily lysophospholipase